MEQAYSQGKRSDTKQQQASDKVNKQTIYIVPKSTIFLGHIRSSARTGCE